MRALVWYLLGVALGLVALWYLVPHERPELEEVLAKRATCQVLIVGPSYVASGIREKTFDKEARRIGLNLESCKYAEVGLRAYELKHALELLLSEPWPKLEHVIIDITLGDKIGFREQNWYKPRVVDWHTWEGLEWLYGRYKRQPGGVRAQQATLVTHVKHLVLNYLGVGRGALLLERVFPSVTLARERDRMNQTYGPGYEQRLLRATAAKTRARAAGRMTPNAWARELSALAKSHGQTGVIFLFSPILEPIPPLEGGPKGAELVVFDFQDPTRYPALYVERARAHTSHLNGYGATIYSQLLAQRLFEQRRTH
jgi:hypothetical protein